MRVYHWFDDIGVLVDYLKGTFTIEFHNEYPVLSDICVELKDMNSVDELKLQLKRCGFVQK